MKKYLLLLSGLLLAPILRAQLVHTGKIEFERKINIQAQFAEMEENEFMNRMKSQLPKFVSTYFEMEFEPGRCIYKPGKKVELEGPLKMMGSGPAGENTVVTYFKKDSVKALKGVFETKFLVLDSTRKLDWQEKDEIRTIAGYKCHKAVSKILDSVYVVAFYAEEIPVSGGPEMFSGLPGMILELAVPRLHTTWVANSVTKMAPKPEDFDIVEKGKKVNQKVLVETVSESFKMWGKMAARNTWWVAL